MERQGHVSFHKKEGCWLLRREPYLHTFVVISFLGISFLFALIGTAVMEEFISFHSIIATIQFGIKITLTKNPGFLKSWRRVSSRSRLFAVKSFHILKIEIYSFFFRSKTLRKITRKLVPQVQRVQQTMWQKLIQTNIKERDVCVSICLNEFCHIVRCTLWTSAISFLVILCHF